MKKEKEVKCRKSKAKCDPNKIKLGSDQGLILFDSNCIDVKLATNGNNDINIFLLSLYDLLQDKSFCKMLLEYYYKKIKENYKSQNKSHVNEKNIDALSMKEINQLITEIIDDRN